MMLLIIGRVLGGGAGGVAVVAQLVAETHRPFPEAIFHQIGCRKQATPLRLVLNTRLRIALERGDLLYIEQAALLAFRLGKPGHGHPDKAHRDARLP